MSLLNRCCCLCVFFIVTACGQKGGLYLPENTDSPPQLEVPDQTLQSAKPELTTEKVNSDAKEKN